MKYLHYDFHLHSGQAVRVTLDSQANVRLLDDTNFSRYRCGQSHDYFGGLAKKSPVILSPPHSGHWNLVIDLGGYAGNVRAGVSVI